MNTPLRDELKAVPIRIKGPIKAVYIALDDSEINTILNLIASKMPEKKIRNYTLSVQSGAVTNAEIAGWNAYHDTFKSILKGGTDEHFE